MATGGREQRRTVRALLKKNLHVTIRSIGSDIQYDLECRDISNRGFFIEFESPGRFPFSLSSIMEVWIELEPGKKIFFNARMVRIVHPEEALAQGLRAGIAVRVVQIDPADESTLRAFVERSVASGETMIPGDRQTHGDDAAAKSDRA